MRVRPELQLWIVIIPPCLVTQACSLFTIQWDSGLATEALALASPETHLKKSLNHRKLTEH